jgi:hypothetical protein
MVIKSRKSKKDKQNNGQNEKGKKVFTFIFVLLLQQ